MLTGIALRPILKSLGVWDLMLMFLAVARGGAYQGGDTF